MTASEIGIMTHAALSCYISDSLSFLSFISLR